MCKLLPCTASKRIRWLIVCCCKDAAGLIPRACLRARTAWCSVVKAVRDGTPFYYRPDMDFGARDPIFVPFFGVPAATITGVARLARLANARIVPAVDAR